jgi:hypothetical protein
MSLRIFLFGILPLLLFANGPKDYLERSKLDDGTYQNKVSGKINQNIQGTTKFQSVCQDEFVNGLELSLKPNSSSGKCIIALTLSRKSVNGIVSTGNYKIKNAESLFHSFEGVYGIADLGKQDKLPFFTNKGIQPILESGGNGLMGSLEIKFKNTHEVTFFTKGFFDAN